MNKFDKSEEILLLDEASSIYTREIIGNILSSCSKLLENELPRDVKEKIAEIDADCCRLIRNRFLIGKLLRFRIADGEGRCCNFNEVYANCLTTARAICLQHGVSFAYSEFLPLCKVNTSAEQCALLLLLPITIALEDKNNSSIRIITSKKKGALNIEYTFSLPVPDIASLAEECNNSGHSNGLFFEETMLSHTLTELTEKLGGKLKVSGNKLTVTLPMAEKHTEISSPSEVFIDNRFSLPYIMLSNIVKREI